MTISKTRHGVTFLPNGRCLEATAGRWCIPLKNVWIQVLSPQGRLVVKLDLQEIFQVYLRYIIHNVPGGEAVKENKNPRDNTTNIEK